MAHDHDDDHHQHHDHGDHHGHGHAHAPQAGRNAAFAIGLALNGVLVVAQIVVGVLAGSLALLADAGHNFGDVLGLLLAWGAGALARRPPTTRRSWGYGRATILSALANSVILLVTVGAIVLEAAHRLAAPLPVQGMPVVWVALGGIAVNGITAWLFMAGREHDLNLRAVFLHMAGDAAVSLAVVFAALAIMATGWLWIDPVVSLGIAAVITWGTWSVLRESVDLAMDAVPPHLDEAAIEAWLLDLPGVTALHDLHILGFSTTETALTVHLVRPAAGDAELLLADLLLESAAEGLRARFGIAHATFQLECGDRPCALAPADVI